jgi:6-phosphogluconate dehydrogenase (decarboxylating)
VDATCELLAPLLARGDVIIDGGNENFANTERRSKVSPVRRFSSRAVAPRSSRCPFETWAQ